MRGGCLSARNAMQLLRKSSRVLAGQLLVFCYSVHGSASALRYLAAEQ